MRTVNISDFLFYKDDPLAALIPGRLVSPHLDDYVDITKAWIRKCQTHPACTKHAPKNRLPTRVIDVGSAGDTIHPFLHESHEEIGNWVTLSHRWGKVYPITLTLETLDERRNKIPMISLPPLFRDAVIITRSLGYRYLWIDSLCIIQDSKQDWISEAAKMGYIYKHSNLTIAAETSQDCLEGVFASSNRRWPNLKDALALPCYSSTRQIQGIVYPKLDSEAPTRRDFLGSRAWTLQEDILSPRTIIWTSRGLKWQCRSADYDEGIQLGGSLQISNYYNWKHNNWKRICLPRQSFVQDLSDASKDSTSQAMEIWYNILQNFVRRNITNHADRLPALSGVAREIARLTGYRYLAGLWSEDICAGLLWSINGKAERFENMPEPSWSWASIELRSADQAARFTPSRSRLPIIWASVLGINIPSVGDDPFGQVQSARLHLRGPCRYASELRRWLRENGYPPDVTGFIELQLDCTSDVEVMQQHDVMFLQVASSEENSLATSRPTMMPPIQPPSVEANVNTPPKLRGNPVVEVNMIRYALVLKPTGVANLEFKRIGISTIPHFMARTTEWRTESIAIV